MGKEPLFVLDICLVGLTEEKMHSILSQLHSSGGLLDTWSIIESDYVIMEMDDYLEETRQGEDCTIAKLINS